jgi:predicted metal-dependent phosphoesterase TrpH
MPGFDLHSHSNRSDGTLRPAEVMMLASQRELAGVALTDHDTFDGLEEAAAAADELGLDFVPGIEFSAEYDGAIARPHIAQAMVEAGIVAEEKEAFDRYISDDGLAYVPKHALPPMEALRLIGEAGGVCVLAHPGMWRGSDSVPDELIERMAAGGMVGLEVRHPDHDEAMRATYAAMAERLDLVATAASDCHGERYGFRMGEERTDAETFAELKRRAGR